MLTNLFLITAAFLISSPSFAAGKFKNISNIENTQKWLSTDFYSDPQIYLFEPELLQEDNAATHELQLQFVVLFNSGWTLDLAADAIQTTQRVLKQCHIKLKSAEVTFVTAPSDYLSFKQSFSEKDYVLAKSAPISHRPLLFLSGTGNAGAVGWASTPKWLKTMYSRFANTEVENTAIVLRSVGAIPSEKDPYPDVKLVSNPSLIVAHELGHILTNDGHSAPGIPNLMAPGGIEKQNEYLNETQCSIMRSSELVKIISSQTPVLIF